MKRLIAALCGIVLLGAGIGGCGSKAGDQEIEQMCKRLLTLRGGEEAAPEEMEKCKADKMITDVSAETAACRIAANDVDTFWNKCR